MDDSASTDRRVLSEAQPAATHNSTDRAADEASQFDAVSAIMRLLLGASLEGGDEVLGRMQRLNVSARSTWSTPAPRTLAPRTLAHPLRSALVGMVFETESLLRDRLSMMVERVSSEVERLMYGRLMLAVRDSPLRPLLESGDDLMFLLLVTIDRWSARGQLEEETGRRMARAAAATALDELLDYLAHDPAIRNLIEQQSVGTAEAAVDEVRGRMVAADMLVERLARGLLRRPARDGPQSPPAGSVAVSCDGG